MYTAKLTITTRLGTVIDEHTVTGAGTAEEAYRAAEKLSSDIEYVYRWPANHEITVFDENGDNVPTFSRRYTRKIACSSCGWNS